MRLGKLRLRRGELLVAAAAALVMVAAAVVIWDLGDAGPGRSAPVSQSDIAAGDSEPDIDQTGPIEQATDEAAAGAERQTDEGSSSGSGSESGSGGGQSNRPPVIESPGLASDGLVLTIEPEVTDPDGDEVALLYDVEGTRVDPAQQCMDPVACEVRLKLADVGYRSDVNVTIIATDSRDATTRQTYSHTVEARTRVTFSGLRLTFDDPSACFDNQDSRVLSYRFSLTGAIDVTRSNAGRTIDASYSGDRVTGGEIVDYEGEEPPPLGVQLSVTLSDVGTVANAAARQYTSSTEEVQTHWRNNPCEYTLTYVVNYETS